MSLIVDGAGYDVRIALLKVTHDARHPHRSSNVRNVTDTDFVRATTKKRQEIRGQIGCVLVSLGRLMIYVAPPISDCHHNRELEDAQSVAAFCAAGVQREHGVSLTNPHGAPPAPAASGSGGRRAPTAAAMTTVVLEVAPPEQRLTKAGVKDALPAILASAREQTMMRVLDFGQGPELDGRIARFMWRVCV